MMACGFATRRVVPAKAGTHTPQRFGSIAQGEFVLHDQRQGLWVPAFAGTTLRRDDGFRKVIA